MVRLATPDDAGAVARLLIAFRDHMGRSEPSEASFEASVARLIADPDTDYLLAEDPACGVCQLRYRHCVWLAAADCTLEDLYVLEEARGKGVGRGLVEAAVARARQRGCARMVLDADRHNRGAIALYESLGFSGGAVFMRLAV